MGSTPRLLIVAHGTASPAGSATTARLTDAVRAARPDCVVDLCFLDVASPKLADVLDDRPTVAVPLLLSTGYHVLTDIPAAVSPYPQVRVARHLGPHPLLVDALMDRLSETGERTVLVGAGSSRPEAAAELARTGDLLAARVGGPVAVHTVADDLAAVLRPTDRVATYLLAPGQFTRTLGRAAAAVGLPADRVAEPIGVHPALVDLVWARYDERLDFQR